MPQIPHTSRARVVPVFTHFFGTLFFFFWCFIFWACLPGGPTLPFGSCLDFLQKRVCFISPASEKYPLCLVYMLMQMSVPFSSGGTPKTKYNQRTRSCPFTLPLLPSVLDRYGLASRGRSNPFLKPGSWVENVDVLA